MNDDSNSDSESNTQKKNFTIDNNSKSKLSERGRLQRKGKGLPMVGIKTSNFQTSKIDVAGRLNVDDVNVDNLKSANVGVNGVKLGERIIE